MFSGDQKRSLTSEIADDTTKKNEFEERRLQKKLRELDELSLKQRKKRREEQLEYALGNLSLDNMASFNSLTRKVLQSGFLPPINHNPSESTSDADRRCGGTDVLVERLRGSRMIQRYNEGRGRRPRNLTSTLSTGSWRISRFENAKSLTESGSNKLVHHSDLAEKQVVRHRSKSEGEILVSKFPARREDEGSRKGFISTERKIQHRSVSEAIEYKLKMRELSRAKSSPINS